MAITTLNLRALNRSDTASAGQLVTATSATAMDFQASAAGGKIGQVVTTQLTAPVSSTSTSHAAIAGFTRAITPVATSSKVLITMFLTGGSHDGKHTDFAMFRDTTQIALGDADGSRTRATFGWRNHSYFLNYSAWPKCVQWLDSPSSTSSVTYIMKWRTSGDTIYLNRSWDNTDGSDYHRTVSSITLQEILA
jgi:hypothetical protein